jgi:hypothetical protein
MTMKVLALIAIAGVGQRYSCSGKPNGGGRGRIG